MYNINRLTREYLKVNGIKIKFFSDHAKIEYSKCLRWLKSCEGANLDTEQLKRVHDFINGKYIKTVEEILREEEE